MKSQHRRLTDRYMEIARTLLNARREQFVDENRSHSSSVPLPRTRGVSSPHNTLLLTDKFTHPCCSTTDDLLACCAGPKLCGRSRPVGRASAFGKASSLRHCSRI